ncbi:MAG: hypothetical protein JW947_01090 [Sedimentisphaerales bacterium]|nr:hypothetical protein [Sedimentisphaerales bacterium]
MKTKVGKMGFWGRWFYLMAAVLTLLANSYASITAEDESIQHYKMISTVEYAGVGEFRSQVEDSFTVRQKPLSNDTVQYFISAKDLFKEFSFVVDKGSQHLSQTGAEWQYWAQVNNHCAKSLKKVTKENIGKTWKQSFSLSAIDKSLPDSLQFTLTAIQVKNQELGDMIAVRALSEPFFIKGGTITSRINSVYLFDTDIEDIYLSASVFESITTMNGFQETLSNKVATCMTDAAGKPVNLKGLGKDFENFVSKLALTKDLKVVNPSALPNWAGEGLQAAQAGSICSSLACEGALNPVVTVSMPAAKVIELQKNGSELITVDAQLAAAAGGGAGGGPWEWLVGKVGFWPAVGVVGAGVAVPVAASGGGGGGGGGGGTVGRNRHKPASP